MENNRKTEVVGIGAVVYDVLMTADTFPQEDTKLIATGMKTQCGGPEATALVAISKMGVQAEHFGTLGDDAYGNYVLGEMQRFGIKTGRVRQVKGASSFFSLVLLNTATASRTCIVDRGNAPMPSEPDLDVETLKDAKYLHVDGNQLDFAILAAKKARELGVKVSYDAGGTYKGVEDLLPLVDILIPSEEYALKITESGTAAEAATKLQERYNPEILIITQGSRGGFIRQDGREVRYPVFPVNAIDSNGAGDTFHGAFVAAKVKGMDTYEAACFASATSALKCTRFGAQEGIPQFDEVVEFMKTNPGEIRLG